MMDPSGEIAAQKRKKAIVYVLTAAVLTGGLAGTAVVVYRSIRLADERIAYSDRQFERIDPIADAELTALRTYLNDDHVEKAQILGISGIEDQETLERLVARGALLEITSTPYYVVQRMEYGSPYVTPSTKNLLELIGIRFQEALLDTGLPPYKFVVSSATRTAEAQRTLQSVNGNAVPKSSHTFGTAVDILYTSFVYAAEQDTLGERFWLTNRLMRQRVNASHSELTDTKQSALKAVLGRVLRQLQRDNKLLAIYERRQPVYHITLAQDIPDPSPHASTAEHPSLAQTGPANVITP